MPNATFLCCMCSARIPVDGNHVCPECGYDNTDYFIAEFSGDDESDDAAEYDD